MPGPRTLLVLPALNEEASVGLVVKEAWAAQPEADVLVVDDGSSDATAAVARAAGAVVISNPFNLGVGAAMRVGFRYAQAHGYEAMVQVDADGQHDPRGIDDLLAALEPGDMPQVVIGARFSGVGELAVPRARRLAMHLLATYLSRVTGTHLTDVTSGFRAHNQPAIELFARCYPSDYLADTVESLVIMQRVGGQVRQVPAAMRPRYAGNPSQSTLRALAYLARVTLVLGLTVIRRRPTPKEYWRGSR